MLQKRLNTHWLASPSLDRRTASTQYADSRHGLLYLLSGKGITFDDLTDVHLFLALKHPQEVAQLRQAERVPLSEIQKDFKWHIVAGGGDALWGHVGWHLKHTFMSPVSFSFRTRLRAFSPGPAQRRKCRGHASADTLRRYTVNRTKRLSTGKHRQT